MSTINLNHLVSKHYTIFDKNSKYYLSSFFEDQHYQKSLIFCSVKEGQEEYIRPQSFTIDSAISFKKKWQAFAPIDIKIVIDGLEITDDAKKSEILESLSIFEHRSESKTYLKSLSERGIKTAKEEQILRTEISNMINAMNNNIGGISFDKCKKLQTALKEIQN